VSEVVPNANEPTSEEVILPKSPMERALAHIASRAPSDELSQETVATETPATEEPKTNTTPQEDVDLALAKARQAAMAKDREIYEAKQRAKDYEAKVKDFEAREQARKKLTPLEALAKEYGTTYEQLTQDIVAGKFKEISPEDLAQQSVKSEVDQIREELAAIKAERDRVVQEHQFEQTRVQLETELKQAAAVYPVLATVPWAAKEILATAKSSGKTIKECAEELEQAASRDVLAIFNNEASLKALLKDDELKNRVLSALGAKQSSAGPASSVKGANGKNNGALTANPSNAESPRNPARPLTQDERIRASMAQVPALRNRA
jgi:hypothetical protein